jgi:peptidoglycan hydrolase-like protein with peptidoglycan-binding domain
MHLSRSCILGITIAVFAPLLAFAQASCPQITRNLSVGSRGADVIQLQQYQTSQGVLAFGNDTGNFGRLTEAAVQQWQSSHGVVSLGSAATTGYGAVGPRTRAALAAACSGGVSAWAPTGSTGSPQANNSSIQSTIDALLAQVKALLDQISRLTSGQATPNTTYYTFTSTASCSWNGRTVASSSSVTAYQSPSVSFGQTCTSQQRVCKNGTLTGSYVNATCVVASAPQTESTATNSEQSTAEGCRRESGWKLERRGVR